jgi:RNA polymerase sigma-70 factor (ECF subfamily)
MDSIDPNTELSKANIVRLLVSERIKLLAYIESLSRNEHLAEDVFQEVCMLAVEKADSIQDQDHLMRWMRTVARFKTLQALSDRNERALSLDDKLISILESAWQRRDADNTSNRTDALRQCIDLLPKRGKSLIEKRYTQGFTYEQLSQETGRSTASLYVTFSRIFTALSGCINGRLRQLETPSRG